jgi:hypothetical protein
MITPLVVGIFLSAPTKVQILGVDVSTAMQRNYVFPSSYRHCVAMLEENATLETLSTA